MHIVVVIPAYKPGPETPELVGGLARRDFRHIIVVDDGSGPEFASVFREIQHVPGVEIFRHAINLGKGAALRTAFNEALWRFPEMVGVVTADSDGQHHPDDIQRVARRLCELPTTLVLGVRAFCGDVPLRSRVGNTVTRLVVRALVGAKLVDTQTGLRGIPRTLLPHLLKIPGSGYEFELDMLITARHQGVPMVQTSIRTIYEQGNRSSHFNPLFDSARIYMVLLRFSILSMVTAICDNFVFFLAWRASGSVAGSQLMGRAAAMLLNYQAARKAVFLSDERHSATLPKYVLLVAVNGFISYAMIGFLTESVGLSVFRAKLVSEGILFTANFLIQRDLVFTRSRRNSATDWTAYYSKTPFTARLTRRYTTAVLVAAFQRYVMRESLRPRVVEIGGANSCFLDALLRRVQPSAYHVVDTNEYGLELLRQRVAPGDPVYLHRQDVRSMSLEEDADAVFSVGLIEHFDKAGTREAIHAHFALVRRGGYAILSFPTQTWLYRAARVITEGLGLWKFPDERPLSRSEVLGSIAGHGVIVFEKTLWPLVFTQHLMVVRKT